ncbi:membrane protein YcaP [Enterobacter sp. SST3]|nr:membrane protein YcaP [Enterobacter sp. SST3]
MKAFDLQRMAFDKVPPEFLGEVALRSLYTFVLVFLFLKITGRRGVRQMSLFEVLIILTLGSAAGDVAFYDDVPMVPVFIVFVTLALLYRLVMWLMSKVKSWKICLKGSRSLSSRTVSWPGKMCKAPI